MDKQTIVVEFVNGMKDFFSSGPVVQGDFFVFEKESKEGRKARVSVPKASVMCITNWEVR